jgi:hypothetical protein
MVRVCHCAITDPYCGFESNRTTIEMGGCPNYTFKVLDSFRVVMYMKCMTAVVLVFGC